LLAPWLFNVWILALETSTTSATVALLRDGETVQLKNPDNKARTAAALTPAIATLLEENQLTPADVGLVAVSKGPGSFTGLRIGITTARIFAYSAGAELVAVDTIDVLAAQAAQPDKPLRVIIDAQRGQVFDVPFSASGQRGKPQTVDVQTWLDSLSQEEVVSGPVLKKLAPRVGSLASTAPHEKWNPSAETTGQLAWRKYQAGGPDDLWRVEPQYHRASAAEEKAAGK